MRYLLPLNELGVLSSPTEEIIKMLDEQPAVMSCDFLNFEQKGINTAAYIWIKKLFESVITKNLLDPDGDSPFDSSYLCEVLTTCQLSTAQLLGCDYIHIHDDWIEVCIPDTIEEQIANNVMYAVTSATYDNPKSSLFDLATIAIERLGWVYLQTLRMGVAVTDIRIEDLNGQSNPKYLAMLERICDVEELRIEECGIQTRMYSLGTILSNWLYAVTSSKCPKTNLPIPAQDISIGIESINNRASDIRILANPTKIVKFLSDKLESYTITNSEE